MENIRSTSQVLFFCFLATVGLVAQTPGPSINMVSGTQWPGGDPFLQRQNEPSMAVSSRNPLHLLGGANDYRTVDLPAASTQETGDAWLGLFKSFNGGQNWTSTLIPGYPQDNSAQGTSSPLKGRNAAADPLVRAGTNGMFYYSGLVFDRGPNGLSEVFAARLIDDNNFEGADTIRYLSTSIIAQGDATHFLDKPSIAVDIPRLGARACTIPAAPNAPAQTFAAGRIYAAYTQFLGGEGSNIAQIMLSQSSDCGVTWSIPRRISGPQQTNQGAALAINPVNGDLYVVWRVFAANNDPNAIMGIVQPYSSQFDDPAPPISAVTTVAQFTPFDQGTTNLSFRTNAYPAIAVDGSGVAYVSWSQRGVGPQGDSRVVFSAAAPLSSSRDNVPFPRFGAPVLIDANGARGHQIMPALAFSSGKLTATWYDFRDDDLVGVYTPTGGGQYSFLFQLDGAVVFAPFVADPVAPYGPTSRRHTVEVRAAQALPGVYTTFQPSVIVSQYAFGTPSNDFTGKIEQLEFDAPNLPMFQRGTVPFFGDYIDIAGPTFVPAGSTWRPGVTNWRFNTLATDPDFTRVVWTDNRNVIQPADGDWTNYTPVNLTGGPSLFDPTVNRPNCVPGQTGSRNQDIYTAALTPGVVISAKGNRKQLSTTLQREFPVTVQNTTNLAKYYRLSITTQPPGGAASFLQFSQNGGPGVTQLDIAIPPVSSASRSVFITSTDPNATVPVTAQEITGPNGNIIPTGLTSSVTLNSDLSNPNISNPNISNVELYTPNISNPNISNPNISNPNISNPNISNPNISNLTVANPNISNPNISNPNISNPNISNPNISNPNISNPNISNPNISNTALTDVSYVVTGGGNTASVYSVKLLQNQAIPAGVTVQVIVSGFYTTPVANGCALTVEAHYTPILNVTSPTFSTLGTLMSLPDTFTPTVALLPGETVLVTIRVYDSTTPDPALALLHYNPLIAITPVIVSTASNTGGTQPPLTLTVSTPSLAPTTVSVNYSATLQAVGGTGTGLVWAPVGNLPASLTLTPGGVLQGSPTLAGTYLVTVKVTDSGSNSGFKTFNLVVNPALAITTATLPALTAGVFYSQQLTSTGGTAPFTWTATPASLPSGLTLSPTGLISGTPSTSGPFTLTVKVTDSAGAFVSGNINFALNSVQITVGPVPGLQNYAYPATLLAATGGAPPYTWSTPGIPGMNLTPGGLLTGLPTTAGNATVTVTDSALSSRSVTFVIASPVAQFFQGAGNVSVTTVSNVNLTDATTPVTQITALPGATISATFQYNLVEGYGYCPGCIDQLTVGFVNTVPTVCQYDGQPGAGGTGVLAGSTTLTAPTTPGRYYVAYHKAQQYTCAAALAEGITPNDVVIGVVDVIPNAVTYQNVVLQGISTAPSQVSLSQISHQINATFNWIWTGCEGACSLGTLAVGFNTDPAPQACGGLNSGISSPSYTVPNQPGRYYLSIDNVSTCSPSNHWDNGIPKSDFSRFIGVVDVLP